MRETIMMTSMQRREVLEWYFALCFVSSEFIAFHDYELDAGIYVWKEHLKEVFFECYN